MKINFVHNDMRILLILPLSTGMNEIYFYIIDLRFAVSKFTALINDLQIL